MGGLRADLLIVVPGILVDASVLAGPHHVAFAGRECMITFPRQRGDFALDGRYLRVVGQSSQQSGSDDFIKAEILMVKVQISMPGDHTLAMLDAEGPDHFPRTFAATDILEQANEIGVELMTTLLALVRTELKQAWLTPPGRTTATVYRSELFDGNGDRLPVGFGRIGPLRWLMDEQDSVLTAGRLQQLLGGVANRAEPALEDRLLADAQFYAWHATEPNQEMGLMLAAVASEVKIKKFMTQNAKSAQRSLVELVLNNPRDVSLSVISLFDAGMFAVVGVSMKIENGPLWKAVKLLFEHRNRFAHRGAAGLSVEEVRADIEAARGASLYLDDLAERLREARSTA